MSEHWIRVVWTSFHWFVLGPAYVFGLALAAQAGLPSWAMWCLTLLVIVLWARGLYRAASWRSDEELVRQHDRKRNIVKRQS